MPVIGSVSTPGARTQNHPDRWPSTASPNPVHAGFLISAKADHPEENSAYQLLCNHPPVVGRISVGARG